MYTCSMCVYNVTSWGRDLPQVVLADLFRNSILVKPLVALCSPSYSTVSALSNYLLFWATPTIYFKDYPLPVGLLQP